MRFITATLSLTAWMAISAHAALPHYNMVDLGDLPGGNDSSVADAINDAGVVVGTSQSTAGTRTFIWDQAQGMRQLYPDATPLMDGSQGHTLYLQKGWYASSATLNNTGTFGGVLNASTGFIYQPSDPAIKLYPQPVKAINDSGQYITMAGYGNGPGYLYNADNTRTPLNGLASTSYISQPMALNNAGQVVGMVNIGGGRYDAVIWDQQGNPVSLNARTGSFDEGSLAVGINSSGTVAGYRLTSTNNVDSFIWSRDGGVVSLGSPANVDFKYGAQASDINDDGVVIGRYGTRGFYWTKDSGMVFLDTLVDGLTPYDIIEVHAINNAGQIVGSIERSDNVRHAFVLTPVPEPGSAALMVLGIGVMAAQFRRRQSTR